MPFSFERSRSAFERLREREARVLISLVLSGVPEQMPPINHPAGGVHFFFGDQRLGSVSHIYDLKGR